METVEIVRMDHKGRGIGYINGKVVFVPNALVEEVVNVNITKDKKNFLEAEIKGFIKKSPKRMDSICPYFNSCGGCNLLHLNYDDTINYKLEKIKSIFAQSKIDFKDIEVIKNPQKYYYRNKIELKIVNGKVGYYVSESHMLVEIDKCLIAARCINEFIKDIKYLNLVNANLIIRCNYNDELLIIIETDDDMLIDTKYLVSNHKIVGIIFNKKVMYGSSHFIDIINKRLFRVSYDAFFQVNPYVTSEMFKLIEEYVTPNSIVMDLYSGVGTLGIIASKKAKKVYSVEIVENAIKDGIINAKMNNIDNIYFMLGDVSKVIDKINETCDFAIIDPPRRGLDKITTRFLKNNNFKNIIYISCDPMTLARDLKLLEDSYEIKEFKIMDMFSYTYHLESFCVLKRKIQVNCI